MQDDLFGNPAARGRFSVRELVAEAEREAFMRRRVYEKQVRDGRLSQKDADTRIDLMEAIAARLRATAHV